jgi:hypothetical protein
LWRIQKNKNLQGFGNLAGVLQIYFLFENIKNENRFEIKAATNQERIQNNKKTDLLEQLILANVKVIKNVVVRF